MAKVGLQILASCAFLGASFSAGSGNAQESPDPCIGGNYLSIVNQTVRSAKLRPFSNPNHMTQGDGDFNASVWLRFESPSGGDLATECPKIGSCGTHFPVWLSGTIPSVNEGIVNKTAYVAHYLRGEDSPCHRLNFIIQVKNCGGFRIYRLPPTTGGGMGYCVGNEKPCRKGQTSPNGWTPGCKAITTTTKSTAQTGQTGSDTTVTTAAVVRSTTTISPAPSSASTVNAVSLTTQAISAASTLKTSSSLATTTVASESDDSEGVDVKVIAAVTGAAAVLVILLVVLALVLLRRRRQRNRSEQNDQDEKYQGPALVHENEAYGPLQGTDHTYQTLPDENFNNGKDKYKDRPLPMTQNQMIPDYQDLDKQTRHGHAYERPRDLGGVEIKF